MPTNTTASWLQSAPDSETIEAIRRIVKDWDGENRAIIEQLLLAWGQTPEQIAAYTWFDIRMAFCAQLLTVQRCISTHRADVQVFSMPDPEPDEQTIHARLLDDPAARQPQKRSGRLPKKDSATKRTAMLAILVQHPSMKDYPEELAERVGASISTIRRWLHKEEQDYRDRESRAANLLEDE